MVGNDLVLRRLRWGWERLGILKIVGGLDGVFR